jgi:hypothetical protein
MGVGKSKWRRVINFFNEENLSFRKNILKCNKLRELKPRIHKIRPRQIFR